MFLPTNQQATQSQIFDQEELRQNRGDVLVGLGQMLSQMAYGRPVDVSPTMNALEQRREQSQMRKAMEAPGVLDSFTPQQRAVLATMPPALATQIISQRIFAQADPVNLQTFNGPDGSVYSFNPRTGESKLIQQGAPKQPTPTDDMREYEFAKSQGYTGTFQDFMIEMRKAGASTQNVNIGDGNNPGLGKLSTDYGYILDPVTGQPRIDPETGLPMAAPVPGSPAAIALQQEKEQAGMRGDQTARAANIVMDDIDRAIEQSDAWGTTGFVGGVLDGLGGTPAHDLQNTLRTVQANIGFDRLQQMREASPTGGALGAVSERELTELQAVLGSVQQSQSKEQLQRNLSRLKTLYSGILAKAQAYPNARDFGFEPAPPSDDDLFSKYGVKP